MSDYLSSSIWWCVLQISVLTLFGLVASAMVGKRRPGVACFVACTTVVVAGLLTVSAPLPVHLLFSLASDRDPKPVATAQADLDPAHTAEVQRLHQERKNASTTLTLNQLTSAFRAIAANAQLSVERSRSIANVAGLCFIALAGVGVIRLVLGIAFVLRVRAASKSIRDRELLDIVEVCAKQLNCRREPLVSETDQLTSAAVAGWFQPTLVLPAHWRQWSDAELRAVVAHEMAHVCRRDASWRALAASISAIHFYNPLAHWLLRRVMLYQELAADELAARVVGRQSYLRSLSSLAIQRDDELNRHGRPELSPVFSGDLIRRIKMLRSMDGVDRSSDSRRRLAFPLAIATLVLTLGLAMIAVRGFAQAPASPPQTKDSTAKKGPAVRVARAKARVAEPEDPTKGMFGRRLLDPNIVATNTTGMIALRLSELAELPEIKPQIPLMNAALSGWIKEAFRPADVPPVDIAEIEWIAAVANLTIRNNDAHPEHKNQLQFGAGGFVIKTRNPVDLEAWITRYAPSAKHFVVEGQDVYQLPLLPAIGPVPVSITESDDGVLLANAAQVNITSETRLGEIFQSPKSGGKANESRWVSAWERIEGGLASIVFTDAEVYDLADEDDHADEVEQAASDLFKALHLRCNTLSYGLDCAPTSSQLGIRIRLSHASRGTATTSAQEIREFIAFIEAELPKRFDKQEEPTTNLEKEWFALFTQTARGTAISVEETKGGGADVVLSAVVPFDRAVALYLEGMATDQASEQPSEAEPKASE
jgi:beta-lactamase regulating signal transducer with metallopeptidase domain